MERGPRRLATTEGPRSIPPGRTAPRSWRIRTSPPNSVASPGDVAPRVAAASAGRHCFIDPAAAGAPRYGLSSADVLLEEKTPACPKSMSGRSGTAAEAHGCASTNGLDVIAVGGGSVALLKDWM